MWGKMEKDILNYKMKSMRKYLKEKQIAIDYL